MKFCPICSKTYENELSSCPKCSHELLNGTPEEVCTIYSHKNEEIILRLYNYLCEIGFLSIQYFYSEKEKMYTLLSSLEEQTDVRNTLIDRLCLSSDKELPLEQKDREELKEKLLSSANTLIPNESAKTYVNARERYEDMMSSASSLIVIGAVGIVFVALVYLKIIPLNMNVLFYFLSGTMFLIFLAYGIFSLSKANQIKASISTEETLTEQIKEFLLHTYQPITGCEEESEEELYFSRSEDMKHQIEANFPDVDGLLADGMIEEVYNEIYPSC